MGVALEFLSDPAVFLQAAGGHLADDPVVSTVVATIAARTAQEAASGVPLPAHDWYVVARDSGRVVGTGMRTASFEPRPLYLLPMPDEAALTLARALHERGEQVEGVNGALPAARPCAEETARLTGRSAHIAKHTRLFEVTTLRPPAPVPGRLRRVTRDDVELATEWMAAFMADADEQAGRSPGTSFHGVPDEDGMLRRIDGGRLWFWEDAGRPVHLTGVNAPSFGVAGVGPVFTPRDQRGRGYASAAVAEASRLVLDSGARVCLFTDQANPMSNALYRRLGYEPVTDMAELVIR